jgi:hypothetical protein
VGWVRPKRGCLTYASILVLRIPQMIWVWRATVEWYIDGENRRTWRKTCPSATLTTTNSTWIEPGANKGLRDERPAANDLSHGTAPTVHLLHPSEIQFLTVASLKMKTFWDTAQCSLLEVRGGFGGAYCLHYQTDYGSNKHLWYVSQLHWYCSAQYPRRQSSSHFILLPLNTCRNENTHGL